jgi:hypothetical protein
MRRVVACFGVIMSVACDGDDEGRRLEVSGVVLDAATEAAAVPSTSSYA